jgi:hypothetical protein
MRHDLPISRIFGTQITLITPTGRSFEDVLA